MTKKKALIEEIWDEQEDIEPVKPKRIITNRVNGEWIDRIYGGGALGMKVRLLQGEFGEEYKGKITEKKFRRYRKDMSGKAIGVYYQIYHHTADGRWFDNSGFACSKPHHEPKDPDIEEGEDE